MAVFNMAVSLKIICLTFNWLFYEIDAAWTLNGSGEFTVIGELFTLTCDPQDSNVSGVIWRRLDIDTADTGTQRATVTTNGCSIDPGSDTNYQYTCGPGPVFILTIPSSVMTNSQNNKVWRCENVFGGVGTSAEYTLTVAVPVNSLTLHGENGYSSRDIIYEDKPKSFWCQSSASRPNANVTMYTVGITPGNTTVKHIENDLVVTKLTSIITTKRGVGKSIKCTASNIPGRQVSTDTLELNVFYQPEISLDTSTITIQEGNVVDRLCRAVGNPTPLVSWHSGSTNITSGTSSESRLHLTNVDRKQTNDYTCKAIVNSELQQQKKFSLIVQYPPTITVVISGNVTENDTNANVECKPDGFPTTYTYHGWTQYVGNTRIRSPEDLSAMMTHSKKVLSFATISYEDAGRYQCEASNGVKGRTQKVIQAGSSSFDVKASAKFDLSADRRYPGEIGKKALIQIPFYSNPPALLEDITWINKSDGKAMSTLSSTSIDLRVQNGKLSKDFHGITVQVDGQTAILSIDPFKRHHTGNYLLAVINGANLKSEYSFRIIASAPPDAPSDFTVFSKTSHSITVTWKGNFNGGHPQTYVIRYSNTKLEVTKEVQIIEQNNTPKYTYEVKNLNPLTTYQFWLYSFNKQGNSSLSSVDGIIDTTKAESSSQSIAGIAAGTVVGCFIVILVITVIYCFRSRRDKIPNVFKDHNERTHLGPEEGKTGLDHRDSKDDMRDNILHHMTGQENKRFHDDIKKPQPVYAEVKKDLNRGQTGDKAEGIVYEEVGKSSHLKVANDAGNKAREQKHGKEKGRKKTKPQKQDQDGLMYVELELGSTSKPGKTAPIHGLEQRTDYADIDFTKKADPL